MSVFASAGDQGAATPNCDGDARTSKGVTMPASDPLVTSVGGTHLNANSPPAPTSPRACGTTPAPAGLDFGAGGGGFSTIFPRPSYQDTCHRQRLPRRA